MEIQEPKFAKPVVGQKMEIVSYRREQTLICAVASKVGREYFYCTITWPHSTGYTEQWRFKLSDRSISCDRYGMFAYDSAAQWEQMKAWQTAERIRCEFMASAGRKSNWGKLSWEQYAAVRKIFSQAGVDLPQPEAAQ